MPIRLQTTDGTTTRTTTIPNPRVALVADALCASLGIDRPTDDVNALASALDRWVRSTVRQHRLHLLHHQTDANRAAAAAVIEAEEAAQP